MFKDRTATVVGIVVAVLLCFTATPWLPTARAEDPGTTTARTVLLLDASGSMKQPAAGGANKIQAAKSALRRVVDDMPDNATVGLRVFGSKVFNRGDKGACSDTTLVVAPGTGNKAALKSGINAYQPYGETPIPAALEAAARDLGTTGKRSIVLVSDGESTCQPDPCVTAKKLAGQGVDLRIDVVGLSVSGAARQQLQCIADSGHGSYFDAASASEIEATLTTVATRAIAPFMVTGQPITGGTSPQTATPIGVGRYVDQLAGQPRHYAFTRADRDSIVRITAYTQGERAVMRGIQVTVTGPAGQPCSRAEGIQTIDDRGMVSAESITDGRNGCGAPGRYLVEVSWGQTDAATAVGLVVSEQPRILNPGPAEPAAAKLTAPTPAGPAKAALGAPSLDAAPAIGAGRWSSTLVPGEMRFHKVHLDHGQSLRLGVSHPLSPATEKALGIAPPVAKVAIFDPMFGELPAPDGAVVFNPIDKSRPLLTATSVVSPRSRTESDREGGGTTQLAGDYYVAVSVAASSGTPVIPVQLAVAVDGTPRPGPTYEPGVSWTLAGGIKGRRSAGASGSPTAAASSSPGVSPMPAQPATTDGASLPGWVVGAVGATAAALVGVGLVLLRRHGRGPHRR